MTQKQRAKKTDPLPVKRPLCAALEIIPARRFLFVARLHGNRFEEGL